jgi:hypothetical protein
VEEEADLCRGEDDVVFGAGCFDFVVAGGSAGVRDVADPVACGLVDVVAERDVPVGCERDVVELVEPTSLFVRLQRRVWAGAGVAGPYRHRGFSSARIHLR